MLKARRRDKELCADEPKFYLEESVLENKLPDITFRTLIELPSGLDYNEWLASHTIAIFDNVNLMYGTISEFCTATGCPDMVGPGLRTYLWFDDKGKKTRLSAPQYVDYVMTFTQKTINDEAVFPTKYPHGFPSSFETIVRKILRLLFHVLAHLYHSHFREMVMLNLHSHLNSVFTHLIIVNDCYHLIEDRELEILFDLVNALKILDSNGPLTKPAVGGTTDNSGTNGCSVSPDGQAVCHADTKQGETREDTALAKLADVPFTSYSDPSFKLPATSNTSIANSTTEVLSAPNF
ncbi:hypothetical protein V9T40_014046 [Parthenolecanium corni]|uniref:MOB kinase activator-like 2 n=1 Tax=Parthenolecanium corni TaxID=536013 RepID=A0AAN9TG17_9HEMI